VGQIVEYCIDCQAVLAVPAIRRMYQVKPNQINRHLINFGDCGLIAALYLLGIGNQLKASDTDSHTVHMSFSLQPWEAQSIATMNDGSTEQVLASKMMASGASVLDTMNACACCGEKLVLLHACAGCYKVKYCRRECQKKDRKRHRLQC